MSIGQKIAHESAVAHTTGTALYTDDLGVRHSNLLHAWPVQANVTHARLVQLETTPALRVPGVVRVLSAGDVPGVNDSGIKHDEPLFPSTVMHHGQAVAWVLAESEDAAREGASAVIARYENLPAVLTLRDALAQHSFQGATLHAKRGDADAALQQAPQTLSGELEIGGQEHFYLETHASLAHLDESGHVFVQSSTQHPSETQEIVAHVLGVPRHHVTVQCLRMGGGFGGKEVQANPFAAVAALGATLTGRPVRVRLNRTQDITLTGKRHPFLARWTVGFDDIGTLLALKMELYADGGWSLDLSEPVLARAVVHTDNAYFIPHMDVIGRVCQTHKTSQTAFRGFGGPQGMVFIEEVVAQVAQHLKLEASLVRERNFYAPGQSTHYHQEVRHAERLPRVWQTAKTQSDYVAARQAVQAHNAQHTHSKRGLAIAPVKFGISFNLTAFNQAGALVLIYQDGSVQVNHGGTEMGQGLHTKMQQIAAHTLGVDLQAVRVMPTRTDKIPNSSATAASSGSDLNGGAVRNACETLRGRLASVAAQRLGVHPLDVRFEAGTVTALGTTQSLGFSEVVKDAYLQRVQLFSDGFYRTPGLHWNRETMSGKPFHYFSFGAAVVLVEVDAFTGAYRFLRSDLVHDVGDSLSPTIDQGQIEGGFMQGLGWLTLEDLRWDNEGRVATRGASTYKLPSLGELPDVFNVTLLPNATEPDVVYGSKAVGEPPLMLAIAAREALRDAVAAFGNGGVVQLASPATPEAVFWAIEAAKGANKNGNGESSNATGS